MLKALLLDLDDTLLVNPMSAFIPAYFELLSRHLAQLVPPRRLIAELMRGTAAMQANDGSGPTNEEAFAEVFYPAVGHDVEELRPVFFEFYATEFAKLRRLTRPIAETRELIEWASKSGIQLAITTNPLFPYVAIAERLRWAGVPADEFDYALVTSYETMHAAKPSPAYYQEIIDQLGRRQQECLMVGDDWELDIEPASSVGIPVYWIAEPTAKLPSGDVPLIGQGTLPHLWTEIRAGHLAI